MNVLFDTNVILDVVLKRPVFYQNAVQLVAYVEKGEINGYLGGTTVTTIYYMTQKQEGRQVAEDKTRALLKIFDVANINRKVLENAFNDGFKDYEDAVLHQAAISINATGIVTRNPTDFTTSKVAIYSPEQLLAAMKSV